MPAKKVDYTKLERQRAEQAVQELIDYLDENSPSTIDDRYEERVLKNGDKKRGALIIKKEDRIKEYYANTDRLIKLIGGLDKLREIAAAKGEKIKTRGNREIPGFMDEDEDDEGWQEVGDPEEDEIEQPIKKQKKSSKELLVDPGDFEDYNKSSHTQDKSEKLATEDDEHDEGDEWAEYDGLEDDEDDDL